MKVWQRMDTLRWQPYLESSWESGKAPWKTWPDAWSCTNLSPGRNYGNSTLGVGSGT
jgi:hypothetical protein